MIELLHYQVHGLDNVLEPSRDLSQSGMVVLLHGLFGSADNLSVIRRSLDEEFCVLSIDLPDHGQSPWSTHFDFEQGASQIISTIEHFYMSNGLNALQCPLNLVAHSLGGKFAMHVAHARPDLIRKLILLDIAPVAYEPRHHNVISGLQSVDLSSITSRKDAQVQLSKHVKDASTQAFLLKSLYQKKDGDWAWRFNLELLVRDYPDLSAWNISDKLRYRGDTLFIIGQNSNYVSLEHQSTIKAQLTNASAKIVAAGHWLHAEKPQVVNTLITKYLHGQ